MSIIPREMSFETLTCRYFSISQEKLSHFSIRINKAITQPGHLQYQEICADCDGPICFTGRSFNGYMKTGRNSTYLSTRLIASIKDIILTPCLLTKRWLRSLATANTSFFLSEFCHHCLKHIYLLRSPDGYYPLG